MNMTEVNTQELSGAALDWATGTAVGAFDGEFKFRPFHPSTDWSQCGPLIAKIKIGFGPVRGGWVAHPHRPNAPTEWLTAEEPLVAICRAIVADKLGMAVSVPAELIQQ
jgi:hypothetical protein